MYNRVKISSLISTMDENNIKVQFFFTRLLPPVITKKKRYKTNEIIIFINNFIRIWCVIYYIVLWYEREKKLLSPKIKLLYKFKILCV